MACFVIAVQQDWGLLAGIARRCKDRANRLQAESYDSKGMVDGSSLGSSPKMICGSFEPIPMSR